ncbi:sporulation protein YunB [Brevibacillus sp. 7WMA2]|uniref:Sporulation protein YunB n=1 Tax=Brevibacillus laterosporus LMG 15441 TaxID=1042163 RepID=A0A075R0J0_BRELA|nr:MULTISPECIES: sporulation protein YunB [Brevibacillus]HAS01263.1 sporulation protein YunB [Brevibacillus sp.]AIG25369.1 sporulation protein YunB [Brevibacillus laterosporus LMG 15441]AUM63936.1 sporulation protein YunB [Brevibacillus laterosporus]AYK06917.1 sporulation protein YunB [Brevibacillus laterosporus]ERM17979.1 sporulation protein YunB [Brevibacillus laterosporus PE36]
MAIRMRRRRIRTSKKKIFFIAFIVFLAIIIQSIVFLEQKIKPTLLVIAKQKSEQIAKEAIADAVTKKIAQIDMNTAEVLDIEKDSDNKIRAINFNFQGYSKIMGEANQRIKNRLKEFESEKIEARVPLGLASGSSFLSDTGPKLPITFSPVGSAKTWLDPKLSEAGINMVMVTIYLQVEVRLQVIIPFATDQTIVTTSIPITNSLVVGEVPDYLYNNPLGKPEVPRMQVEPPAK